MRARSLGQPGDRAAGEHDGNDEGYGGLHIEVSLEGPSFENAVWRKKLDIKIKDCEDVEQALNHVRPVRELELTDNVENLDPV